MKKVKVTVVKVGDWDCAVADGRVIGASRFSGASGCTGEWIYWPFPGKPGVYVQFLIVGGRRESRAIEERELEPELRELFLKGVRSD